MSKKKPIAQETLVSAATDMLRGKSIRKVSKDYSISQRDARFLSRNLGLTADDFRELVISKSQVIMEEILDKIREKLDLIPPNSLAITYGILHDKMEKNFPSVDSLTLQQNNLIVPDRLSREELLKCLIPKGPPKKATSWECPDFCVSCFRALIIA